MKVRSLQRFLEESREDSSKWIHPKFSECVHSRDDKLNVSQVYIYHTPSQSTPGLKYSTIIETFHNEDFVSFIHSDIKVYCECKDFYHRCAQHRLKDGSLFLNKHNKQALKDLDFVSYGIVSEFMIDENDIGLCKHLISALDDLRVNFKVRSYGKRTNLQKFKQMLKENQ